ncbi:hypothetical protein [Streptococcus zhangguiae]|uniref:DUF600 family protein n=1 Tax=Streptococcus zhangguiae TaxID=2664091 RepID=A0A6I4RB54_9STRE|nr:hypothetical protein [Streptococcus sp. zg-70]MWV55908.1 hypothetical protein [Streptococcus sp. zg-70]
MINFEDRFMEIQSDMVSLGLEYVRWQADKVYIYSISEQELVSFNIFFKINNSLVKIHKVNSVLVNKVDDSIQFELLHYGNEDIEKIISLCKEYNREHPTEMWLLYDVKNNTLESRYSYEARYEKDEELIPRLEFDKWFEEINAEENK